MEWLIDVLLLFVGMAIGFFGARLINTNNTAADQKPAEKAMKELMSQHANSHILESKRIVQLFEQQTLALNQQIEAFEQVMRADPNQAQDNGLSYFSEHASTYLRNKGAKQGRIKSTTSVQPLDFSAHSSGLFKGDESSKVSGNK